MKCRKILAAAAAVSVALTSVLCEPCRDVMTGVVSAAASQSEMYIYRPDDVQLQYTISSGEAVVHAISSLSMTEEFVIPSELNGCPVTTIAEDCTVTMEYLEGLVIPESVERILSKQFILYRGDEYRWVRIENPDMYIPEVPYVFGQKLTVLGKSGSTAERYCFMNTMDGIRFKDYEKNVTFGPLTGVITDSGVTITGCDKSAVNVVIPDEINGVPVTAIGTYAFADCTAMESVYIPDTVTEIGDITFSYCTSLTDVRLPEGLKTLPSGCFQHCKALTEINLPDSITTVGSAFYDCSALESVDFPDNVTSVGGGVFNNTPFKENNTDENGLFIVKGCLLDAAAYTGEELVVPDGVRCIADSAFSGSETLKTVVIPDCVEIIGEYAFRGCEALTSVTLPDTLTEIREGTFERCTSLASVDIPSGLKMIDAYGFNDCWKLGNVSFPDTLTEIGYGAFMGCASLTEITLPGSLISAGNAFTNCTGLKKAVLSDGIKEVGYGSFSGCTSLEELVLPADLETVGTGAFNKCTSLTEVALPETVQTIGGSAFGNCTSLAEVTIPEKNGMDISRTSFLGTPWYEAFSEGKELVIINDILVDGTKCTGDVVVPDGVAAIGSEAFKYSEVTSVTVPDSIQRFGSSCFYGCKNLTEFTIPEGVTEIALGMFYCCAGLKNVDIPETITAIRRAAFEFCDSLTEFTVPKNVEIVEMAFEYCDHLKKITFENPDCFILGDSENFFLMPQNTTVCGYAESTAYCYAFSTRREFEFLTIPGDVNADTKANVADAVCVQLWLLGDRSVTLRDWKGADLNGDGVLDIFDLIAMRQMLVNG
ncbi:MAG: leucine-rich repeat protein [Ruminococcus sp.]|nr:leucine-rich repeat protein [Ruminococcus sp.]